MLMLETINEAARELIDRYGDKAVEHARERVELLKNSGERTELDMAMMVLSEIENIYDL